MWIALCVSLLGAVVTAAGIYAVRTGQDWALRNQGYFISFAAGVLVAVSLLHLVPQSLALAPMAPVGMLSGFLLLHLLKRFLVSEVCDTPQTADFSLGLIALSGIGVHSLLDGLIYSVSFNISERTGLLVAPGMIVHEFPEGIVTYTLLLCSGFSKRRSTGLALVAAAFSTPLGTLVSYPIVGSLDPATLGLLLSVGAGALLYVGAAHLLPRSEQDPVRFGVAALFAGVIVAVIMGAIET